MNLCFQRLTNPKGLLSRGPFPVLVKLDLNGGTDCVGDLPQRLALGHQVDEGSFADPGIAQDQDSNPVEGGHRV